MGGRGTVFAVLGFGIIFGTIGIRMNELESSAINNMSYYSEVTSSHNLAVAGANAGLAIFYQDTLKTNDVLFSRDYSDKRGPFFGGYVEARTQPVTIGGVTHCRVRSTSLFQGYRDTVEVFIDKLTVFDILGLMVAFGGVGSDEWITKDSMWGRVHFNGRVGVHGSPVYNDKSTTTKGFSPPVGTGINRAIFKNGYETGVNSMQIPALGDTADTFPSQDMTLTGNWSLLLADADPGNNDGFFEARNNLHTYSGGAPIPYFYNIPVTRNGVVLVRGDVSIKGVVDGKLTIAATGSIYIDDDVTYKVNPETTPSSDDILGLVCINDIKFNEPNIPSKHAWNIQAVMSSLSGTLSTANKRSPPPEDYIRTYGGITTRDAIDIAQASGSSGGSYPYMNKGFYRRFHWDTRLGPPTRLRPPSYPVPDNLPGSLQIVDWWENVRMPTF